MLSRIIYGTATTGYTRSELRKIKLAKKNFEITASSTKASWKKTDTSLMLYDSSFNGRLSHELQVQIVNIYRLAIKELEEIMVAALPVQQQTAVHLPVG